MLSPNEGIRHYLKSGLLVGLLFGLIFGLIFGLGSVYAGLDSRLPSTLRSVLGNGLGNGLLVGLTFGLLGGLGSGLLATLQHYTLRFWLWQAGWTPAPWRYVAFLDDATARILLQRIGGGYSFIHRLLLEYFANLDTQVSPTSTAGSST